MRARRTERPVLSRKSPRDSRVQRTQRALHEALIGLVREKDYDRIAVREILARAHVGRSTFYAHFADKDELLVKGIEQILARSDSRRSPYVVQPADLRASRSAPADRQHEPEGARVAPQTASDCDQPMQILVCRAQDHEETLYVAEPGRALPFDTGTIDEINVAALEHIRHSI
jgi:AcrR family transcriptional regulator